MTSQKRFRHHQDGGKNRDRFKDLPPRFKRQKSSTSPTRDLSPSDVEKDSKTTNTHEEDSQQVNLACSPAVAAVTREQVSSGIHQFKQKAAGEFELAKADFESAAADQIQSQQLSSNPMWQHTQKSDGLYFASPWDYQDYLNGSSHQPTHVPLGTHFGYQTHPPPLYPWAAVDPAHIYGPTDITDDPVWRNSHFRQGINCSSGYNENLVSRQYVHLFKPQDGCWDLTPSVHYSASSPPPVKNSVSPSPTESGGKIQNNQRTDMSTNKQKVDYSDPDIRTIEMLRELERVADQKERESEEFGADRKSLVSHHLRMLMCAVDRYTEGIEDDLAMTSRHDEVRQASDSRGSTPGVPADPVNSTVQEQNDDMARNKIEQNLSMQSPRKAEQSVWNETPASSTTSNKLSNKTQESYVLPKQPQDSYILPDQMKESHLLTNQNQKTYGLLNHLQESYIPQNLPKESYILPNQPQELNVLPSQPQKSYVLSPHTPPFISEQNVVKDNNITSWDLWSSPTFDFCNMLTNHNSDISAIRSMRERRPLYQRQFQNC